LQQVVTGAHSKGATTERCGITNWPPAVTACMHAKWQRVVLCRIIHAHPQKSVAVEKRGRSGGMGVVIGG
jgi:hypothetical protein